MDHNPYLFDQLMHDKLAELRAEGMRSQLLAQINRTDQKKLPQRKLHLPDWGRAIKFLQDELKEWSWVLRRG